MRQNFSKLLSIPVIGRGEHDDAADAGEEEEANRKADDEEALGAARPDGLRQELRRRKKEAKDYILIAARLIAPTLDRKDWAAGFKWVIDALKVDHEEIASEMEIEKALMHLRSKQFDTAIEVLKAFEKKDKHLKAMAATNLSFIYFLETEFVQAEKYADMAYAHDRYNAKALVNKG